MDATGRAQAQALASFLRGEIFDHAVSSDLVRAYDTARVIRGELPVVADPRWREFAFGEWEGLTWEQILDRWPQPAEHGRTAAKLYAPPGGESFQSVQSRVSAALNELQTARYKNVLVVTHAGPLHAMLHVFFGEMDVRFEPAGVTRVGIKNGEPQLVALNEIAHLL